MFCAWLVMARVLLSAYHRGREVEKPIAILWVRRINTCLEVRYLGFKNACEAGE